MQRSNLVRLALGLIATVAHGQQSARVVRYHANDIVPIRAKLRYTTLIELPSTEKILEVATGDKDFWIIDAVGSFCFLHPAKAGIHSNLNLITDKGNVYSFTLDDVEASEPDLKVVIEPSDPSALAAANGPERLVPAAEVEVAHAQAKAVETEAQQSIERFRSEYPVKRLVFDYVYKDAQPFDVQAIYHDDRFTYIRSSAQEKFAVYAVKEGKPDLIGYQLESSVYILPLIMDHGYLELGKRRLAFDRKGH
jgi:type IV secretion system protein VirB9